MDLSELSPEARALIERIKTRIAPEPKLEPAPAIRRPAVECDRCGLRWTNGKTLTDMLNDAKFRGWEERRRYGATRHYCPEHAREIRAREAARKRRRGPLL